MNYLPIRCDAMTNKTNSSVNLDDRSASKKPVALELTPIDHNHMRNAILEGINGVQSGDGGPFGAVIVNTVTNEVLSQNHNRVLSTNDPTAHAEVCAIREACSKLGRFSLHDCVIYSSCEPCPMCLSAIIWAKMPKCYYSATADDAAAVGFDDRFIYDFIQGRKTEQTSKYSFGHMPQENSVKPFKIYSKLLSENKSGEY